MVRLRSRYLTCFYCGKRSDTRFDGGTRQFTCKHCDATNHLDENGEITDPPVATDHVANRSPIIAAFPQQPAAATTTSQSIFCSTCLKNQRLFVAAIAQYTPGDGDDKLNLDRDYYRYRRNMESRYPQVCADCEAAAGIAIQRAEYTAKTDHLRKMMEMSRRQIRGASSRRRRTTVDWVHLLAQAVWWGALALQLLWHLKLVVGVLAKSDSGMSDPDDSSIWSLPIGGIRWVVVTFLPEDDSVLARASVMASVATAWWNPKFVQVSRGFTKPLSGFRHWYMYQALICVSRYSLLGDRLDFRAQDRNAHLSAHAVMAAMSIFVCVMASRSIKTDTTPLFAPHPGTISPKPEQPRRRGDKSELKTLAETLDEVLPQPGRSGEDLQAPIPNDDTSTYGDYHFTPKFTPAKPIHGNSADVDEMEWTPTTTSASLPRALRESPSSSGGRRAFGQAPTSADGRPFYYKTPPAPVAPARKLRNPPNQPALWGSAEKKEENGGPSFKAAGHAGGGVGQRDQAANKSTVEFERQHFFAPRKGSAEDDALANMLGKSFTLADEDKTSPKKGWFGWSR